MNKIDAALAAAANLFVPDLFDNPQRNARAHMMLNAMWDAALIAVFVLGALLLGAYAWAVLC